MTDVKRKRQIFPQPQPGDLDAVPDRYLPLNDYWSGIIGIVIDEINDPDRWIDIEEVIEGINALDWNVKMPEFIGAKGYRSSALNTAYNVRTKVPIDATSYLEGFTLTNGELVATVEGYYRASGCVSWNSWYNGVLRQSYIYINGEIQAQSAVSTTYSGSSFLTAQQVMWEGQLAVGDSIALYGTQAGNGALLVTTGVPYTWLAIHKIGGVF